MGVVRVGTASWANRRQLASGWYPRSVRTPAGRLAHYASRFDLVEADTGHYAIPAPEITAAWAAATPPGFTFDVKAFGLLTGHPTSLAALPADLRPAGADLTTPCAAATCPSRPSRSSGCVCTRPWTRSRTPAAWARSC
ncbi:DUF72 domain-containing protein [Dactylosporangium darangshiense]|uniref:DUF72 domain-containing protein n=1 Tax=Dactylosporangium darangshiense TaxID=579108 RepID=UPI003634A449